MKKIIRKIVDNTNEIHWFAIGGLGCLIYKEYFIARTFAWYDFIIYAPFFGLMIGVVMYRWLESKVKSK